MSYAKRSERREETAKIDICFCLTMGGAIILLSTMAGAYVTLGKCMGIHSGMPTALWFLWGLTTGVISIVVPIWAWRKV